MHRNLYRHRTRQGLILVAVLLLSGCVSLKKYRALEKQSQNDAAVYDAVIKSLSDQLDEYQKSQ